LRGNTKGYGGENSLDWLIKRRYNCT